MKRFSVCVLFILLSACAPSSVEDFRCEGEAETRALSAELSRIHSPDELRASLPRLRKKFIKLSDLIIAAREFLSQHSELEAAAAPGFASDELFAELARLYEMPGGRELIESAQIEAIDRIKEAL